MAMQMKVNLTVILLLLVPGVLLQAEDVNADLKSKDLNVGQMNFMQHCEALNLRCEQYDVVTEDGYILTAFRIVGDKTKPVLLWHGILDSADTYLLRGVNSSGAVLNDAGYDVWVGNSRGNRYGRRHTTLNSARSRFWDFSFHEMGYYDLAATIDFVLERTGQTKLAAMGHSQGTSIFYLLAASRPEYNEKIKLFISLAPIAFLNHVKPILRTLIPLWPGVSSVLELTNTNELFEDRSAANRIIQLLCTQGNIGNTMCNDIVAMSIAGVDPEQLEQEFFEIVVGRYPAGTSRKDVDHYSQVFFRKRFANYDYGVVGNILKYRSITPPDYDLTKVTAPVALLCGQNDRVSVLADVDILRSQLPNVVLYKIMDREEFNHIDFIWGKNINEYLNPLLKELLEDY